MPKIQVNPALGIHHPINGLWMHSSPLRRLYYPILVTTLLSIGIACSREMEPSTKPGPMGVAAGGGPTTDMTEEGCILHPEICHPDDGGGDPPVEDPQVGHVNEVGPLDYSIRSAPGIIDPFPTAEGVYLAVSDSQCYTRVQQYPQQDSDHDGLTDLCEYRIARAFAPMLNNSRRDGCFGGEPYWAAKYFDNDPFTNTGDFVRIAYMPAYYEDCGPLGHLGDSEFIQVTVGYNYNTKHWEMFNGFLSAHTCVDENNNCFPEQFASSQEFPSSSEFEHPGGRARTYPRVYISTNKHANYKSDDACDNGGVFFGVAENCNANDKGRFMVWESHNIGNARYPLVNCTPSQRLGADPAIQECFWTAGHFHGWNAISEEGPPGYVYLLHSFAYGCKWLAPGHWVCSSYGI